MPSRGRPSGEERCDLVVEYCQGRSDGHMHVEVFVGAQSAAEEDVGLGRFLFGQLPVTFELFPIIRRVDRVVRLDCTHFS